MDALHCPAHCIGRVDALLRVGRVCRDAVGLQQDLRPAPLSDLQLQLRCFPDDHKVRLQVTAHRS